MPPIEQWISAAPPLLQRHATPGRIALLRQFLTFGVVGVICFVVDTATVYALRDALGLYVAGLVSYVTAASVGWALNRVWTFRAVGPQPRLQQWSRFVVANAVGLVLNRGVYFALITWSQTCMQHPVLALAAGAVAGMFVNFALNRRLVFR